VLGAGCLVLSAGCSALGAGFGALVARAGRVTPRADPVRLGALSQVGLQRRRQPARFGSQFERSRAGVGPKVASVDPVLDSTNRFFARSQGESQKMCELAGQESAEAFSDVHLIARGGLEELAAESVVGVGIRVRAHQAVDFELQRTRSAIRVQSSSVLAPMHASLALSTKYEALTTQH
jgi:hypothetical protein